MITVVIPVYNRAELLPLTLACLLKQTRPADEILVVDDGSTDDSANVAESFSPKVRVIRQSNQGPSAARNRGLFEARGEWIHFFDSDDLALPNLHAQQLAALDASYADIAYSPWLSCSISPNIILPKNHIFQKHGLPRGNLVRALLTNWSILPICCLVRTSLARQVGGFLPDLRVGEDQLFFLRLLLAGAKTIHTPDTLVVYRADNTDKISDASINRTFLVHWARFLLLARSECLLSGFDPCDWFDYRLRVWDAYSSICSQHESSEQVLLDELWPLFADPWPRSLYSIRQSIRRKGGGLTWRLFGRRAHRSFRSAPIRQDCLIDLQQLLPS
jgi:glycosyltransferase involved in cell wall biosynthesis